jgi:tetratricopeptide (TPR) repeat protein
MISTPDRRITLRLLAALALALAAPGGAAPKLAETLVRDAQGALARSDGIAAEALLTKALAAGTSRDAIAARMGEAFLDQGDLPKAREWLGPARFLPAEAAHGWRMLGRLELAERQFPAAGVAFDRALALTPDDSRLWVDIARLRYVGGQQLEAIAAADRAVKLDPGNVRALEFRGMMVRDAYGLAAALPWFEAGLHKKPDDLALLGEYAATLGELGRAREMLTVTRRMIELEPRNPRAFYLQAVLAARAGNFGLARSVLNRTGRALAAVPAAMLLDGILTLEAGNANLAADQFERIVRAQPQNRAARLLLARALYAAGERQDLLGQFSAEAARADASPYLLTLLGRAAEDIGRRDLAAPLLDRAATAGAPPLLPAAESATLAVLAPRYADTPGEAPAVVPYVRQLLAAGRTADAGAVAERVRSLAPGSADAQTLAGDLKLAAGDFAGAVERYRLAASVRLSDDLMLRLVTAYGRAGESGTAARLVDGVLAGSPRHPLALRLAAGFAAESGDWGRAARLLTYMGQGPGARDARLWADLALARQRSGDPAGARAAAERAYRLQRGSAMGAQAWGMVLADSPTDAATARTLLAKARDIAGNNPLLQQTEAKIGQK